ncbi:65-kDa microtubule-associated protein 1 [Zea mays]|uniref:65-kDa microtubule-associated protein 1 n=1 Tax=Zea mays TaxID=4577 RepID=A0A1D6LXR5_MAIZE|nr:65-kDa microtubule-associated protein 1 [Zea mays]
MMPSFYFYCSLYGMKLERVRRTVTRSFISWIRNALMSTRGKLTKQLTLGIS